MIAMAASVLCLALFFPLSSGLMFQSSAVTSQWDTWAFVENNTFYACAP